MVIGARGNLGAELCRQAPHDVVAIGRSDWSNIGAEQFANVDVVIHVASDLRSPITEHPHAVLQSELMVTARLLELMREHSTPRLMYVSSCAVYGLSETQEDTSPCCPVTINGQMKLLNESIIKSFCAAHGIQWEAYRVFNMYGGADHFSIVSRIINAARLGTPITIHNEGMAVRDFIHVSDVAKILMAMLEKCSSYSLVNIGTGRATKIRELIAVAQKGVPRLQVTFAPSHQAIDYSVANTERLHACIGAFDFQSVVTYLHESLGMPIHRASI